MTLNLYLDCNNYITIRPQYHIFSGTSYYFNVILHNNSEISQLITDVINHDDYISFNLNLSSLVFEAGLFTYYITPYDSIYKIEKGFLKIINQ
jgi:hypothetical protein